MGEPETHIRELPANVRTMIYKLMPLKTQAILKVSSKFFKNNVEVEKPQSQSDFINKFAKQFQTYKAILKLYPKDLYVRNIDVVVRIGDDLINFFNIPQEEASLTLLIEIAYLYIELLDTMISKLDEALEEIYQKTVENVYQGFYVGKYLLYSFNSKKIINQWEGLIENESKEDLQKTINTIEETLKQGSNSGSEHEDYDDYYEGRLVYIENELYRDIGNNSILLIDFVDDLLSDEVEYKSLDIEFDVVQEINGFVKKLKGEDGSINSEDGSTSRSSSLKSTSSGVYSNVNNGDRSSSRENGSISRTSSIKSNGDRSSIRLDSGYTKLKTMMLNGSNGFINLLDVHISFAKSRMVSKQSNSRSTSRSTSLSRQPSERYSNSPSQRKSRISNNSRQPSERYSNSPSQSNRTNSNNNSIIHSPRLRRHSLNDTVSRNSRQSLSRRSNGSRCSNKKKENIFKMPVIIEIINAYKSIIENVDENNDEFKEELEAQYEKNRNHNKEDIRCFNGHMKITISKYFENEDDKSLPIHALTYSHTDVKEDNWDDMFEFDKYLMKVFALKQLEICKKRLDSGLGYDDKSLKRFQEKLTYVIEQFPYDDKDVHEKFMELMRVCIQKGMIKIFKKKLEYLINIGHKDKSTFSAMLNSGNGGSKKHLIFNKKRYTIYDSTKGNYIKPDGKKTYLKEIKGKYRYL